MKSFIAFRCIAFGFSFRARLPPCEFFVVFEFEATRLNLLVHMPLDHIVLRALFTPAVCSIHQGGGFERYLWE